MGQKLKEFKDKLNYLSKEDKVYCLCIAAFHTNNIREQLQLNKYDNDFLNELNGVLMEEISISLTNLIKEFKTKYKNEL